MTRNQVLGAFAGLLVLVILVAPGGPNYLTPAAYLRLPIEAILGAALLLALPARPRRIAALTLGAMLGLLAVLKLLDAGFQAVLDRSFDPVLDWPFLASARDFLAQSIGAWGAFGAALAAILAAIALALAVTWSVLRLSRLAEGHRGRATRIIAVLAVVWLACATLSFQIIPGVRVAAHTSYDHIRQVGVSLRDHEVFLQEAANDRFRNTPSDELLAALRGKDVVVTFVESYGRSAIDDPQLAALLEAGDERLRTHGFASRSAYLTSPTTGGGSWLAHATFLSGLWVSNQQRYRSLSTTGRLPLSGAFQRAGWRTVAVMPGVTQDWPEGGYFGYDRIYAAADLDYRGPSFSFDTMPDQYTLSAFQRRERTGPVMAEIALTSSHAPWSPVPEVVAWDSIGDGSGFTTMAGAGDAPEAVWQRSVERVRNDYRRSIAYSLESLLSYLETYGDDNLVLIFLGDHQPAPIITGAGASRDVPISIVTRDQAVLARIAAWDWSSGLTPRPQAPVWRMDAFRDRFLDAFSG